MSPALVSAVASPRRFAIPLATPPPLPTTASSPGQRLRIGPIAWFGGLHLACFAILWTGVSWTSVGVCVLLYAVRMFAIIAGYHRLFSHRSYATSRPFAFLLGLVATTALQRGPLWWASVHRIHHRSPDGEDDVHSPVRRGFWFAHVGWILGAHHTETDESRVRDWVKFPELRLLDRFHWVAPLLLTIALFFGGEAMSAAWPALHTSGAQLVVWGMVLSTVLVYHASWCVNSVLHTWGWRRFDTKDGSRNNRWVAWFTFGEGWHNNHHRFPASERQGFYRGEIDVGHAALRALSWLRLVRDLKGPPAHVLAEGRDRG